MGMRAMLLRIRAIEGQFAPLPRGHHAHAFFLRFIQQSDPHLSRRLHDEQSRKPYTIARVEPSIVSQLYPDLAVGRGDLWLRLTFLDDTVFGRFEDSIASLAGTPDRRSPLRLDGSAVAVSRLIDARGRGAVVGETTFEELLAGATLTPDITLHFGTPTAFSLGTTTGGGRRVGVLPDPGLVFHSLLRKWNQFAPDTLQLDPTWRDVIEGESVVAAHDVSTAQFSFPRHIQVGFIGWCRYRVLTPDPQLLRLVNTLADFATFAGVGSKTTMGMGQTWRTAGP